LKILNGEDISSSDLRKGNLYPYLKKNNEELIASSFYGAPKSVQVSREEKRKIADSAQILEKINQNYLDKEAEDAIAKEKLIIKYRLFILYTITISRIKELRNMAKALYNKLDDWIIYGIKAENDAIYEQVRLEL